MRGPRSSCPTRLPRRKAVFWPGGDGAQRLDRRLASACLRSGRTQLQCRVPFNGNSFSRCPAARRISLVLILLAAGPSLAAEGPAPSSPRERTETIYREAQRQFLADTNQSTAAWQLARATFDLAEVVPEKPQREELALEGIAACRQAISRDHRQAGTHYYLAMNLGQLARCRPLSGLKLVYQMRDAFERARELDEQFDFAGPDRNLGLLYREAPGWPASLGDRRRARRHLERAVELVPDHPANRLHLAETALEWKNTALLWPQVDALKRLLPAARQRLTGPLWEDNWTDWEQRWSNLLESIRDLPRPKPAAP